jgi:hypothetical protein
VTSARYARSKLLLPCCSVLTLTALHGFKSTWICFVLIG